MEHQIVWITQAVIEIVSSHYECAECGTRFDRAEIDLGLCEADGSFVCLECRYVLLLQKYQRLKRMFRVLQRAFAEIKFALLGKGGNRWEVILGICEAYRGKFDVRFD